MRALKEEIIRMIRSEGPISFERFMDMALYFPSLGYYTSGTAGIGRAGDFYTSPHLHSIFGAMIGRQMEEMWEYMGRPERFQVVEMGAGTGYLCYDILDYLGGSGRPSKDLFKKIDYTIIEISPSLRARQAETLLVFPEKVSWKDTLKDAGPFTGCMLSNELLDAFPVKVVEMGDRLEEVCVSVQGDDLVEVLRPAGEEVAAYFREFAIELPPGYRTEVNLRIKEWLMDVSEQLAAGFILTVDYGYETADYYGEERSRGTLLCYHRHQVCEDPYRDIGGQDITAHVNFSSLKRWGNDAGLKTVGFCPQGTYLVSLGIDTMITELFGDAPDPFAIAKIKGLILPQGMGESHKVMVQYKGGGDPQLRGFSLRNAAGRL